LRGVANTALAREAVMIDLRTETLLSLAEAARRLPPGRLGRRATPSCLFRWIRDGVRLPDGRRVCLDAARLGHRWLTSVEALQRFADRLTPAPNDPSPTSRPPSSRRRASEQAARELDRLGL
jgi:hypothetical protein